MRKTVKSFGQRLCAVLLAAVFAVASTGIAARTAYADTTEAGTYELEGELSAYLAAMGGVEFGGPLMTGVSLIVDDTGAEYLYLTFTKSSVTIYEITCDTFVDHEPSTITTTRGVEDGTIGIYDADGNLVTEGVEYTLSEDTALNAADEEVNYVDSITYPISSREDSYNVALYINSNVMGVEFCNENDDATESCYQATLTINWDSLDADTASETTEEAEAQEEELEANEDLDGLSIYDADDDAEETADAGETEETESADAEEVTESTSGGMTMVIVIIVVVIIIAVIAVVMMKNKKKKEA